MVDSAGGSGGFRPSLVETSDGVTEEASFLASEHREHKRGGITVAAAAVAADSDGNKIVVAGTVMSTEVASGPYAGKRIPYNNALGATVGGTADGFLPESINLRDGDVICGLLVHGSVLEARVTGLDSSGAAKADLAGRIIFQ